jgi:exodeoxyribonuclease VIII
MPAITTTLTNAEYRQADAISKSDLDLVAKSPDLLEWARNAPAVPNDTADIGNAVHCALLEPERFEIEYIKMPAFDKRTKAGKEDAANFEAVNAEKIVLSAPDYDMVIAMRDSVLAHPLANNLLTSPGQSEASIFFEVDGIKCKCRPDRIVDPSVFDCHIIADVKTTDDIDKFHFSIRDYRYHVQDAYYSEGYRQLTGELPRFPFVVVGKKRVFGRHPVRVFELTQEDKDEGRAEFMADLERYQEFKAFGGGFEPEVIKMARSFK